MARRYSWRRTRLWLSGVISLGLDSSGRRIYVTRYMRRWLRGLERELGWAPIIVQGGFMVRNGGGAQASAGYHDGGGCVDFRTRTLNAKQLDALIAACRKGGAAAWRRDQAHGGMDPHCHIVLGSDNDIAPGARRQWLNYLGGGDGLASGGRDYEKRPSPVPTKPPAGWLSIRKARR